MAPSEIDYFAFALLLFRWFLVALVVYIVVLIILRVSGYYRIKKCPNCSGELKRSQRNAGDRLLRMMSFGILPVKRFRCYTCYWEGRAFEFPKGGKKESDTFLQDED